LLKQPDGKTLATTGLSLLIGIIGAAAAWLAGFPAPALTGSAIAITIAGLAGLKLDVLQPVRDAAFLIIGMTMGAGVTPEVIETARQWPASFIGLAISIVATFWLGAWALRKFWKYDRPTAILSSTPGHLSYILGLSSETKGDIAAISVVQSIRVLALTLIVPFAIMGLGYGATTVSARPEMALLPLGLIMLCSAFAGFILNRFRIPAALLLGGMLVSTVSHLLGWVEGDVPVWLSMPAFAVMGTIIGTRFSGVSMKTLARSAGAGIAITLLGFALCVAATVAVAALVDVPIPQLLIAFAPGGVEAMAAMAVMMNADPTFVAAHHVWRLAILTFLAPMVLGRKKSI